MWLKQKHKLNAQFGWAPIFQTLSKNEFGSYLFKVFEVTHTGGICWSLLMPWSALDTCWIYVTTIQIQIKVLGTQYRGFGDNCTPVRYMLQAPLIIPTRIWPLEHWQWCCFCFWWGRWWYIISTKKGVLFR